MEMFVTDLFEQVPTGLRGPLADFHARFAWVPPEQTTAWTLPIHGRTLVTLISRIGDEPVASSNLELWFSRRRLSCLGRIDNGPVAASPSALGGHLDATMALLGRDLDELAVRPMVLEQRDVSPESLLTSRGFLPSKRETRYSTTLVLDIRNPLPEILRGFKPATRRNLARAARESVECRVCSDTDSLRHLVDAYNRFAHCRRLPSIDIPFITGLAAERLPGTGLPMLLPVEVVHRSNLIGGALFLLSGNRMVYRWGFTDRDVAPGLPILHGCFWFAIQQVHGCGIETFDLGGFWPQLGASDSINRFKLGFSAVPCELGREYSISLGRRLRWVALSPAAQPRISARSYRSND